MQIRFKIALSCLGIAALVGVVGWRSAVTNDAVRAEVEHIGRSSVRELMSATDMLLALETTRSAAQRLVAEGWRARLEQRPVVDESATVTRLRDAVQQGITTFDEQLQASRAATEAALAMAEQRGDARGAVEERRELHAWLDRLDDELEVHRVLLAELVRLAPADPQAASRFLDERVDPHYLDAMSPLIEGYQQDAEHEMTAAVEIIGTALAEADGRNTRVTLLAFAAAVVLGLLLARAVARPIRALREAAGRLGSGDLGARVQSSSRDEVGALAAAFNHMADRLQATTVSKSYVDEIIRSMDEILLVTDLDGRIETANRAAAVQLGWSEQELVGRDVHEVLRPAEVPGELVAVTRDQQLTPVMCTPVDLKDGAGPARGRLWVAQSIRAQKDAATALRKSLDEKEVLLREVHHRVKNNLQVICSLLRLQAAEATPRETARLFEDSESRIRSMALIHELLYRSGDLACVDFREYVEALTRNVLQSLGAMGRPIRLVIDVGAGPLGLDAAIPCGLILNELVSNALEHAFPDGRAGSIRITFHQRDASAVLVVADDGIGLLTGEEPAGPPTLGLRLVAALARQLRATVTTEHGGGTQYTVAFPVPAGAAPRAAAS